MSNLEGSLIILLHLSFSCPGLIQECEHHGQPTSDARAWTLTEKGQGQIQYHWNLGQRSSAFAVRTGVPVSEQTPWELLLELERKGWVPEELPSAVAAKRLLQFTPHSALIWYFRKEVLVPQSYLRALLNAETLFEAFMGSERPAHTPLHSSAFCPPKFLPRNPSKFLPRDFSRFLPRVPAQKCHRNPLKLLAFILLVFG